MINLRTLRARSVRGIPRSWPDLPIGTRGIVVYGPNGVGKSSLVDAIEFAITSQSTLFSENRLGVSWEAASAHVKDGQPDIGIGLKAGAATHWWPSGSTPLPSDVSSWVKTASSSNFVLRRHMLLRFITEVPRNRYDLLAPFFNLGAYQGIEATLRRWASDLETAQETLTTKIVASAKTLYQVFALASSVSLTPAALVGQLNAFLAKVDLPLADEASDLADLRKTIERQLGGHEQSRRLGALGTIKTQAQRLGRGADFQELMDGLRAAAEALERETADRTADILVDLLGQGKLAIERSELSACPLCEQPIDRAAVLARLEERIKADERIVAARRVVSERQKALYQAVSALAAAMSTFLKDWASTISEPLPPEYESTGKLLTEFADVLNARAIDSHTLRGFADRFKAAVNSHEATVKKVDDLIVKEGGGERRSNLQNLLNVVDALLNDAPKHWGLLKDFRSVERRKRVINRIHEHAIEARKAAVQTTLEAVSTTANRYYEAVHPKENIATSKLTVREVGQGSVNLSTNFAGNEEHPMLHLSESHLDTLGLCYFLALRKHEAEREPSFRLIVLDDVMHSVDAEHRGRVAELLRSELSDHQIVITTHDKHFYDILRATLGTGGFSYQSIADWDLVRGPILSDPSTDLDVILDEDAYTKRRSEDLSAAGGRFFEWLLKQLNEGLQVAVLARFSRGHDIGSLWPPLCPKLKGHAGFATKYPRLAAELDASKWVRNACGAHDNIVEVSVTHAEVREFAGGLAALYQATHCECGFIKKQDNGDWRCACGALSFSAKGAKSNPAAPASAPATGPGHSNP